MNNKADAKKLNLFSFLIIFSGKTVLLRKKAISTKQFIDPNQPPNQAPNVYYVTLTSCDKYGRPEFPVCLFDGSTKKNLKKHGIQVLTVKDLQEEFRQICPHWDGKSDLFKRSNKTDHEKEEKLMKIFEDAYKKRLANKDLKEFKKAMDQNGINFQNAYQELLRRLQNPNYDVTLPDVYILLYSFIKRHRKDHIFVDEMPILHSKASK